LDDDKQQDWMVINHPDLSNTWWLGSNMQGRQPSFIAVNIRKSLNLIWHIDIR
jgi:hypothetical protein